MEVENKLDIFQGEGEGLTLLKIVENINGKRTNCHDDRCPWQWSLLKLRTLRNRRESIVSVDVQTVKTESIHKVCS